MKSCYSDIRCSFLNMSTSVALGSKQGFLSLLDEIKSQIITENPINIGLIFVGSMVLY